MASTSYVGRTSAAAWSVMSKVVVDPPNEDKFIEERLQQTCCLGEQLQVMVWHFRAAAFL